MNPGKADTTVIQNIKEMHVKSVCLRPVILYVEYSYVHSVFWRCLEV